MGLSDVFKNGAATIIKAFGDVAETVVFVRYGDVSYNEQTKIKSVLETVYTPKAIFTEFSAQEIKNDKHGNILPTDIKALIANRELPEKPAVGDKVTRQDGREYNVHGLKTDPAEALWIIHLRTI